MGGFKGRVFGPPLSFRSACPFICLDWFYVCYDPPIVGGGGWVAMKLARAGPKRYPALGVVYAVVYVVYAVQWR